MIINYLKNVNYVMKIYQWNALDQKEECAKKCVLIREHEAHKKLCRDYYYKNQEKLLLQKANYYYNKNMNRTNKHRKYYYNETTKSMELLI